MTWPDGQQWRALGRRYRKALAAIFLVLLAVGVFWGSIDLTAFEAWANEVNPALLFLSLVFLPMATFPVSPLNLIAGVRFGFWDGLLFVAATIFVQHFFAYYAVRVLPKMLLRRIEPIKERLPSNAHTDASVFASLIPGAPYWTQLYALPLMGVPLVLYVVISGVLHTIRSATAVLAGVMAEDFSAIGLCFWCGKRLTRKYGQAG